MSVWHPGQVAYVLGLAGVTFMEWVLEPILQAPHRCGAHYAVGKWGSRHTEASLSSLDGSGHWNCELSQCYSLFEKQKRCFNHYIWVQSMGNLKHQRTEEWHQKNGNMRSSPGLSPWSYKNLNSNNPKKDSLLKTQTSKVGKSEGAGEVRREKSRDRCHRHSLELITRPGRGKY